MNFIQDFSYFCIRGIIDVSETTYHFIQNCIYYVKHKKTYNTAIYEYFIAKKNTEKLYNITNSIVCSNSIKIAEPKNTKFLIENHDSKIIMLVSWIGTEGELAALSYTKLDNKYIIHCDWNGKKPKVICTTSIIDTNGKIVYNKRLGYDKNNCGIKNFETVHDFMNEVKDFDFYVRFYYEHYDSDDD